MDVEAVGGGARLAGVAHLGEEGTLDRLVDVGVREDEEGRIPAQLHRDLQHLLGCLGEEHTPHFRGAGERQLANSRIRERRADGGARTI